MSNKVRTQNVPTFIRNSFLVTTTKFDFKPTNLLIIDPQVYN